MKFSIVIILSFFLSSQSPLGPPSHPTQASVARAWRGWSGMRQPPPPPTPLRKQYPFQTLSG